MPDPGLDSFAPVAASILVGQGNTLVAKAHGYSATVHIHLELETSNGTILSGDTSFDITDTLKTKSITSDLGSIVEDPNQPLTYDWTP